MLLVPFVQLSQVTKDHAYIKARVGLSLSLLVASKLVTIQVGHDHL